MLRSHRLLWFLAPFALAAVGAGCAGNAPPAETSGALSLSLELVQGIEVDEVRWTISGGDMDPMTGVIDTSAPGATASVEVFGLPPGDLYLVELEAIGQGGEVVCRGDAPFGVDSGEATEVMVMLNCKAPERFGGVRVNGELNACAELEKAVVSPLLTSKGEEIDLSALAFDLEGNSVSYLWSATSGSISNASAPVATYTCEQLGIHQITIEVSDDGFASCVDSWTVDVVCQFHPLCNPADNRCTDASIDEITPCCELPVPDQASACTGSESVTNPTSCTPTGNAVTHRLNTLETASSCNIGYDLDRCDGASCLPGGLAPFEGLQAVDNALTGLAPVLDGVGGNLGGVNQSFSDGLCGITDDPVLGTCLGGSSDAEPCTSDLDCPGLGAFCLLDDGDCSLEIPPIDIELVVDANFAEGCANVQVNSSGTSSDVILNLASPTEAGTACVSGVLGTIPISVAGYPGQFENSVVRMTVSGDGFSDGLLGVTIDEATAVAVAELLLEGAGAVVSQVLDIDRQLTQDTSAACNALSATFEIGGSALP